MRKLRTVLFAGLLAATISGPAMAQSEFQVGVQGGFGNVKAGETIDASGGTFGVIGQAFIPISDEGLKFGVQVGAAYETANESSSLSGDIEYDGEMYEITVGAKASVKWSFDVMPMIAYDLGEITALAGGGLSFMIAEIALSATANDNTVKFSERQTHIGWKVAGGLNLEFTENFVGFAQVHYAQYQGKKYFDLPGTDEKLKVFSGRVGLMYRF